MTMDDDDGEPGGEASDRGPFLVDRRDDRRVDLDATVTIRSPQVADAWSEGDTGAGGLGHSGLAEEAEFMVEGEGEDISVGGMYVMSEERLPAGVTVDVEFAISEVDRDFDIRAEVRWTRRISRGRKQHVWGVGLEFEDLDDETRELLEDFVLRRLSE